MLFIVNWTTRPEHRNAAVDRFLKTGGNPPAGVKMVGRWHAVGRVAGVAVADASDAAQMQKWVLEWSDLLAMEVIPVLTDDQIRPLFAGLAR